MTRADELLIDKTNAQEVGIAKDHGEAFVLEEKAAFERYWKMAGGAYGDIEKRWAWLGWLERAAENECAVWFEHDE